jgi:hypothetical protein
MQILSNQHLSLRKHKQQTVYEQRATLAVENFIRISLITQRKTDESPTYHHRIINHPQPNHPLHPQIRIHNTIPRVLGRHRRRPDRMEQRARRGAHHRVDRGIRGGVADGAERVVRPRGRGDEALRGAHGFAQGLDVVFRGEEVGVDGGCVEGVGRGDGDRAA